MTIFARAPRRHPRAPHRAVLGCVAAASVLLPAACGGEDAADGEAISASSGGGEAAAQGPESLQDEANEALETFADEPDSLWTVTGNELPDSFPVDVPLPSEYTVIAATQSKNQGEHTFVVQLETTGHPREVFDQLTAQLDATGWSELQKSTSNFGNSPTGSAIYTNGTTMVNLGSIVGREEGSVAITYSILPDGSDAAKARS